MTTIHEAYINALLADATYALKENKDTGYSGDALKTLLTTRMTPILADFISKNFSAATHIDTSDNPLLGSGFDATVWRGNAGKEFAGKTYISLTGSEDIADFTPADLDLTVSGAARQQIVDMVNWWLKNTAAKNSQAQQIEWKITSHGAFFVQAATVDGTGIITEKSNIVVDGHSLGGHLATAFTRLFGGQAGWSIDHTYTYNSAGFTPNSDAILKQIEALLGTGVSKGYFEGLVGQSNFFAENGLNVTTRTFLNGQVGLRTPLFNEESPASNWLSVPNHYMYKLTDALALADAIYKLDNSFDFAKMSTLFDKGANKTEASLEGILDGLRKSILGNVTDTPIGDVNDSASSRVTFYENLKSLTDSTTFQSLIGKVTLTTPASSASEARSDFGAFLSLMYLTPFALKTSTLDAENTLKNANSSLRYEWEADNNLSPEKRANGEAVYSDMYLNDRAAMLSWVVKRNTTDDTDLIIDGGTIEQSFIDYATNITIHSGGGLYTSGTGRNHYIFGDDNGNPISGYDKDDHIYGGAGDDHIVGGNGNNYLDGGADNDEIYGGNDSDTLIGGTGDDTLEGGKGIDQLYGGDGNDTLRGDDGAGGDILNGGTGYDTYYADDGDTIIDSDGKGQIWLHGKKLTFATRHKGDTAYKDAAGNVYLLNGTTLKVNDPLTIENFTTGDFGLELKETLDPDDPDDPALKDAFNKAEKTTSPIVLDIDGNGIATRGIGEGAFFDFDANGFAERTGWVNTGDGLLVRDLNSNGKIDNGSDGADYLAGGAGADTLTGGLGADTLVGGAGYDIYYADSGDTIVDADGSGLVIVAGIALTGGRNINGSIYKSENNEVYYQKNSDNSVDAWLNTPSGPKQIHIAPATPSTPTTPTSPNPIIPGLGLTFTPKKPIDPNVKPPFDAFANFPQRSDPFTLDLDGDGIETVAINPSNPILFDINADGIKTSTGWIAPDDGMLVLDRNGNGTIDDGTELFGDATPLADGKVNSLDAHWNQLQVWRDLNQDGLSQQSELFTLDSLGITGINVAKHNEWRMAA